MTRTIELVDLPDAPAIPGLAFRRLRGPADYAAIAALIRAGNLADGVDWIPDAENVRIDWENHRGFDPGADAVFAELAGEVIGYGRTFRQVRDGRPVYLTQGCVHPAHRRRGIGRAILHANERRSRELARAHPDERGQASMGWFMDSESGGAELMLSEGYRVVRYGFAMVRPTLDDIPDVPMPDGLEIRPVRQADHRAIWDADVEAFQDHWGAHEQTEEDFLSVFRSPDLDTSLWRVAWDGDEVAGSVQNWIWREENEVFGVRRGWLEHISVRRPWRRRGLASGLIAESLRALRDAGMDEAMLGVDAENPNGAVRLYEALGFRVKDGSTAYWKDW